MTVQFRLGQYARHDFRVWSSPAGVIITDTKMIDALEKEYRCQQAAQTHLQRIHPNGRAVAKLITHLKATPHVTPRESRGKGRAE